jgi:transposase-like protein
MPLTDIHYKVLNCLVNGISVSEAARTVGVHRNTINNWCRHNPEFMSLLKEAREERGLLLHEEIEGLVFKAVKVLRTVLQDVEAPPSVRLRAVREVLKLTVPGSLQVDPIQKNEILHKSAQSPQPVRLPAEPGRNSLCPCNSGLKFKRCCANKPAVSAPIAA